MRTKGHTLIEMAVATAVIGVLGATAIPSSGAAIERSALETSAEMLAGDLRYAVTLGDHCNGDFGVRFDRAAGTWTLLQVEDGQTREWAWPGRRIGPASLPAGVQLIHDLPAGDTLTLAGGASIPAASIRLTSRAGSATVTIAAPLGTMRVVFGD